MTRQKLWPWIPLLWSTSQASPGTDSVSKTTTTESTQSSQSSQRLTVDEGRICLRCLGRRQKGVLAQENIPDCIFRGGPRHKKYEYCSKRWSERITIRPDLPVVKYDSESSYRGHRYVDWPGKRGTWRKSSSCSTGGIGRFTQNWEPLVEEDKKRRRAKAAEDAGYNSWKRRRKSWPGG